MSDLVRNVLSLFLRGCGFFLLLFGVGVVLTLTSISYTQFSDYLLAFFLFIVPGLFFFMVPMFKKHDDQ